MSYVSHLECANCNERYEKQIIHNLCIKCNRPLYVRYHLDQIQLDKETISKRKPDGMWKYKELLPVQDEKNIVSLGETMTPLLKVDHLATKFFERGGGTGGNDDNKEQKDGGCNNNPYSLYIKDESRLPTGSFKARGMAMAISMCKELGVKNGVAVPTAGNAGGAMAAYAARASSSDDGTTKTTTMQSHVFMPHDTPIINQKECYMMGAKMWLVNGLIDDCGKLVAEGCKKFGWFNISTLKEPYRIEGKKTMGLELAEQFNWTLPDVILYPTGGGTGLIGMWKAFDELTQIGLLDANSKKPRMYACQSDTCCPIVRAYENGERYAKRHEDANTIASGLRVPSAVGDFMILDAVRDSGGMAISVSEDELMYWCRLATMTTGISVCPESGACLGALRKLLDMGHVHEHETIVIFNTGAMQKYPEAISSTVNNDQKQQNVKMMIDVSKPIDWDEIMANPTTF